MKYRCKSNKGQYAHIYSNKGIKVCEEWQDFEPFYEWAMNNGYSDALTIDRIDSDGDYCPENCRWVDMKVQSNNTSRNVYIEFEGECHTLAEWADIVGISYSGMANRYKRGWSVERMLTTPNGR